MLILNELERFHSRLSDVDKNNSCTDLIVSRETPRSILVFVLAIDAERSAPNHRSIEMIPARY